jgi:hypothetical protein
MPPEQLAQIPEVQTLARGFGGNVEVSPVRSATSATEVRVETNLMDIIARVKNELEQQFKERLDEHEARLNQGVTNNAYVFFQSRLLSYVAIRL